MPSAPIPSVSSTSTNRPVKTLVPDASPAIMVTCSPKVTVPASMSVIVPSDATDIPFAPPMLGPTCGKWPAKTSCADVVKTVTASREAIKINFVFI